MATPQLSDVLAEFKQHLPSIATSIPRERSWRSWISCSRTRAATWRIASSSIACTTQASSLAEADPATRAALQPLGALVQHWW